MIDHFCLLLKTFREAFPKSTTVAWFVVEIFGFIVRLCHHGVSSSIRRLQLLSGTYMGFRAFFRSWTLTIDKIVAHWLKLFIQQGGVRTRAGALIWIGDGIKVAKEAKFMPGVKKLHQDSANFRKAPRIFGHHFGVLGMLGANRDKAFCVPVIAKLHEGAEAIRQLLGKDAKKEGWRRFLSSR